jgi:purine catabolism regulator
VLRPLVEADRLALVPTLRAWLAHNGQWDSAAAELGVHRHTVRARIARAGELLGKDLTAVDSADARMELWFALRVREGQ